MANSYTVKDVRTIVENCVRRFNGTGWDYLAKQFPIVFDDKLPAMDKINLDQHNTFSFANQYYVGFSETRALEQITNYYSENELELSYYELEKNICNVIKHEYGHILLEHVFKKPKSTEIDKKADVISAEIETNRGVPKYERGIYFDDVIISDEKDDFKTVQQFITNVGIFNEVKRILKENPPKNDEQNKDENADSSGDENDKNKNQNNSKKSDAADEGENQPSENSKQGGEQSGKQFKKPDNVGTMLQAMDDASNSDNAQQRDLLSELGLQASDDFKDGDIKERLKVLTDLAQNDEIKKTLSKIKGTLAGDISREKVGTYSRPSRKTGEDGLMRRGVKRGANKRPNILIALDESGSMDCTAVQTAATAIKLVAKTIGRNRSDVTICSFSTSINRVARLNDYDYVVNKYSPYGGTNFASVIEYARKLKCDVVLCIGDGYDSLPSDCGNIKWIDILITPHGQVEKIKQCEYTAKDKATGRRETLWLGNNKRRVEQFANNM